MKKKNIALLIIASLTLLTFSFSSCESSEANDLQELSILEVSYEGISKILEENMTCLFDSTIELSDMEKAMLITMQEEEKLARDVYTELYTIWNYSIFSNIADAEKNHMNAVISLLQNYGVEVSIQDAGLFESEDFQSIYQELIAKGSVSLEEALNVGAMIEEMDIYDLNTHLTQTENGNVQMVFENLLKGSRNHLRAFNRKLSNLGIEYIPQYISQEEYDSIINSAYEQGNHYHLNKQNRKQYRRGRN